MANYGVNDIPVSPSLLFFAAVAFRPIPANPTLLSISNRQSLLEPGSITSRSQTAPSKKQSEGTRNQTNEREPAQQVNYWP